VSIPGAQAGFDAPAPPVPTDRLFLALFPDHASSGRIATFAAKECTRLGLHGRPLRAERLHLTLFYLGDRVGVPADMVAAISDAAQPLGQPAFDLALDTVASLATRSAQKPFVLKASSGNAALHAFHARLARSLERNGLGEWTRGSFEPHVTLAYDRTVVAPHAVPPIGWMACDFVLVHSLLGQTRHVRLARWTLAS
jgi:2'-5' RNA ligase